MAFAGYLIKCGSGTSAVEIPMKYIRYDTYEVTPDQRLEWSAERDTTGNLYRETLPNMPPKIEFTTHMMTNTEVAALNTIISGAYTVAAERKLPIEFYDPETDTYKTWNVYVPDIKYKIRNIDRTANIINYNEIRYAFIGY